MICQRAFLQFLAIVIFFLPSTCIAQRRPYVVYLSGGGSARLSDIMRRDRQLKFLYRNGPWGQLAEVKTYFPDQDNGLAPPFNFRWYSRARLDEIIADMRNHEGSDLHVMATSMGGGMFRDVLVPELLTQSANGRFRFGTITVIDAMNPDITQPHRYSASTGLEFDVYTSIETTYVGLYAPIFKGLSGAGSFEPAGCNNNCFYIRYAEEIPITSTLAFYVAIQKHGDNVGFGEDGGELIAHRWIKAANSSNPGGEYTNTLIWLSNVELSQPKVPVPDRWNFLRRGGSSSGGGGGVSSGGSGSSGGGAGVESFPAWLSFNTYLKNTPYRKNHHIPVNPLYSEHGDGNIQRNFNKGK